MALLSMAWVCSRWIARIVGSNTAEGMDVRLLCYFVCCVGRGLCDGLITCSEERESVCVI